MASITETPPAAIREELTRLRRQLGRDTRSGHAFLPDVAPVTPAVIP